MKKYIGSIITGLFIVAFLIGCIIQAPISQAVGSLWSLLPPVVAIGLALITKEVYSSLFIGILCGGVIFAIAPRVPDLRACSRRSLRRDLSRTCRIPTTWEYSCSWWCWELSSFS